MTVDVMPRTLDPFSDVDALTLAEYRGWVCEICGKRPGTQRHHALYRRDKRFGQLDCAINYQLVCPDCHMSGEADSRENRLRFYEKQCDRYGKALVDGWIESLPLLDKSL